MTDDQRLELRRQVKTRVQDLYVAAFDLLFALNRPGMTIERLKQSDAARALDANVRAVEIWLAAASDGEFKVPREVREDAEVR